MSWFRHYIETANLPISYQGPEHTGERLLRAITISWDTAPTTNEDLTVTLDSDLGPAFDIEIYTVDPAADSLTAVLLTDINLPLFQGDAIDVDYANTDHRTVGIQIILSSGGS